MQVKSSIQARCNAS